MSEYRFLMNVSSIAMMLCNIGYSEIRIYSGLEVNIARIQAFSAPTPSLESFVLYIIAKIFLGMFYKLNKKLLFFSSKI